MPSIQRRHKRQRPGTTDDSHRTAAIDFADCIVPFWKAELGPELLGIYVMGSLAHGGFCRRYSDIDIAVVTEAGLSTRTLARVRGEAIAVSADLGPRLSVFWTDRHLASADFLLWIESITSIMRLR